jgi:hypothetical protein
MQLLGLYQTNESLLQSYRAIFISAQTFFLAVGAILSARPGVTFALTVVFGIWSIFTLWIPTVRSRARIVDWYKYGMERPDVIARYDRDRDYVKGSAQLRKEINDQLIGPQQGSRDANLRPTRRNLDVRMPYAFVILWAALGLETLHSVATG